MKSSMVRRFTQRPRIIFVNIARIGSLVGAPQRLKPDKGKKFGEQADTVKELMTEFAVAFLCSGFRIKTVEKGNRSGYIDN